jgi:hypothetical protein
VRRIVLVAGLVMAVSWSACGSGDEESSGVAIDARVAQSVEAMMGRGVEQELARVLRDRGTRMLAFRCRPADGQVLCAMDAVDSDGTRGSVGVAVVIDANGGAQGHFTSASNAKWVRARFRRRRQDDAERAGDRGVEPRVAVLETAVLPIHQSPEGPLIVGGGAAR